MRRATGILLHPTSLPGPHGIGDLGAAVGRFLDWLGSAGATVWQVLPLGPTTRGTCNSPYASPSAFAGNPLLVALDALVAEGSLPGEALDDAPAFDDGRVDYARVSEWKHTMLRRSWDHVRERGPAAVRAAFDAFRDDPAQAPWLDDWTVFAALKTRHGGRPWVEWDGRLRRREPEALTAARAALAAPIELAAYLQFQFFRQWEGVRRLARERGVTVMGDVPIYVAHDSADVWAHGDRFLLDEDGQPRYMAGVPPDYFSDTGQLWGNPIFNWRRLKADGYRWWIERIRANLRLVDWIRLDHFRGFVAYWRVPRGATTAQDGRWIRGPGRELFDALVAALGTLPFVAEDLGVITPAVRRLRRELGLPGMKVLQFGFDEARSTHHPDRVAPDEVVYTGTHDNDTTRGWLATLDAAARARVDRVLARQGDRDAVWALVAAAQRSPATLAVVPMQDVLGLGSEARMNTPAVADGNWAWRLTEAGLEGDTAARLRALVEESGRR